jgi:hypothetical protein
VVHSRLNCAAGQARAHRAYVARDSFRWLLFPLLPARVSPPFTRKLTDVIVAKDGSDEPPSGGRNFHGETRSNDTHASTTDPEARLYRKGKGKKAKHSYIGNALTENRHGLVVEAELASATGTIELFQLHAAPGSRSNSRSLEMSTLNNPFFHADRCRPHSAGHCHYDPCHPRRVPGKEKPRRRLRGSGRGLRAALELGKSRRGPEPHAQPATRVAGCGCAGLPRRWFAPRCCIRAHSEAPTRGPGRGLVQLSMEG